MIKSKCLLGLCLGALFSTAVFAQITMTPETVELRSVSQSEKVFITYDGQPVLPVEITKIVSGVFKTGKAAPRRAKNRKHFSNYSYMFEFKPNADGSITIKPNQEWVQEGTYVLYVHTDYGTVTGSIKASLLDSFPEKRNERQKKPEFTYEIVLPDYTRGQQIAIQLSPDKVNTYYWYVNGKLFSSGLGETSFSLIPEVGTHEISFVAKNPSGDVVSSWSDTTVVTE